MELFRGIGVEAFEHVLRPPLASATIRFDEIMAIVDFPAEYAAVLPTAPARRSELPRRLHRIRTVRLRQGLTLEEVASRLKVDVRVLRLQEHETTDIRLSDLHKWSRVLGVPVAELLIEPDSPLVQPAYERSRFADVAATARRIGERTGSTGIRRMARMMLEQIDEIVQELEHEQAEDSYQASCSREASYGSMSRSA